MPEWPNSEMDKLFQEGSEQYDFEYNPEAWQQMDNLLNQQERRRRALWWIFGSLFIALFFVLFSFFFFVKNAPEPITDSEKTSTIGPSKNQSAIEPTPPEASHSTDIGQQENVLGETIQQEQALPPASDNGANADTDFQQESSIIKAVPNKASSSLETKATAPLVRPIARNSTSENETDSFAQHSKTEDESLVSFENTHENGGLSLTDGKAVPLLVLPNYLPYPAIPFFIDNYPPVLKLPVPTVPDKDGDRSNKPEPSFLIGLLGASEFNSVGQGDYTERNWKFGLQLEYRFANRFAIKTGANYIHMWYDAGKDEYIPEKGFWVDGIAPVSTRGLCNMVEIPILLSYYFKGHQNDGFFATAGVASYIILEEHYWYKYENPPTDPIRYWRSYADEPNWLNIGHISVGYSKFFSGKWSVQISPYVQVPLTGVGHGDVKIYSLGLQGVVGFRVK